MSCKLAGKLITISDRCLDRVLLSSSTTLQKLLSWTSYVILQEHGKIMLITKRKNTKLKTELHGKSPKIWPCGGFFPDTQAEFRGIAHVR
jgi:hypothetical protein